MIVFKTLLHYDKPVAMLMTVLRPQGERCKVTFRI